MCCEGRRHPRRTVAVSVAFSSALALALAGCSSDEQPDVQVVPPARAAESPVSIDPDGEVLPLDLSVTATAFDEATNSLVVLADDELLYFSGSTQDPMSDATRVALPGPGTSLTLDGSGNAITAAGSDIAVVSLESGEVQLASPSGITAEWTAAVARPDGTIAAGTDRGQVFAGEDSERPVTGLVSADVLIASGANLAAIDRRQSMIIEVFPERGTLGFALRAGNGASNAVTDGEGRVFVVNTRDGELLVYTLDRLVLRQRYPVPDSPFGIAYDAQRDRVWVTQTGLNEVAAYALDTGIPVEVARFATVQQPDSVAVDSAGGYLYVSSATGGGVQRIPLTTSDE